MERYMIISSLFLMTAVSVRAQCERPNVGGNLALADESGQETFSDGAKVKLKCATGYVTDARTISRSITCTGTQWSQIELYCKKKSCGHPGEIYNGKYVFQPVDAILFGATITAVCDQGYHPIGLPTRNCREFGWDGRAPECEAVKCQSPSSIKDGWFTPEEEFYNYGESVTFSCNRDLDLIGSSVITCSDDGNFKPSSPRCISISCDKPEIKNANKIEGKSAPYKYNNFVRYRCNKGYRMEGSDTVSMKCTERGWDPAPPTCEVVTCAQPSTIKNGKFTPLDSYEYEQTVTYSCNKGYKLQGASTIQCTEDGLFQPSPPQCEEILCASPSIINGEINIRSQIYKFNASVYITCHEGYRLKGSANMTCKENGWSPSPSQCIDITCDAVNVNNAVIEGKKEPTYKYNMVIRYKCITGYEMEGSNLLTCKKSGWTQSPPKCNIVTCSPPPKSNGEFTPVKPIYNYKETVTYSCMKSGLKLNGASTISCTENGSFQPAPQCVELTCDKPQIEHGFADSTDSSFRYKSTVRVRCNSMYQLDGSNLLTCEENGWNSTPQCSLKIWVWLLPLLGGLGVCLCGLIVYCIKQKKKEDSRSKHSSRQENCSLVNLSSRTEEFSPKDNY